MFNALKFRIFYLFEVLNKCPGKNGYHDHIFN